MADLHRLPGSIAVLLLVLAVRPGFASADNSPEACVAPQEAALAQQFRDLPPRDRLAVLQLLAERHSLQQLADVLRHPGGAAPGAVDGRLRHAQRQLAALLPLLTATTGASGSTSTAGCTASLVVLQELAVEQLAADLQLAHPAHSRLKRALTLVNIAWFCGCVLLVAAATALVGAYVAALAMLVPLAVWEALAYGASLWVLHRAMHSREATAPYVALTGLLMFTACVGGTLALHLAERFRGSERAAAALMAFFALAYGAVAVRLQASQLGTIAVWWAVSALGFSILVSPFLTVIGFRNGLARPFAASLLLILAFLPFKVAPAVLPLPTALRPFETGVWLWCTLVANVANLIMADRGRSHHQHEAEDLHGSNQTEHCSVIPLPRRLQKLARVGARYAWSQLPAVAVIGGTLACGIVLDIEQCRAVGSVFAFLWFCAKLTECNWKRVGHAWAALACGAVLWAFAYAMHTWPQMFMLSKDEAA